MPAEVENHRSTRKAFPSLIEGTYVPALKELYSRYAAVGQTGKGSMLAYSLALIDSIKSCGVRFWASWSQVGPEELGKWSLVLEATLP